MLSIDGDAERKEHMSWRKAERKVASKFPQIARIGTLIWTSVDISTVILYEIQLQTQTKLTVHLPSS